MDRRRFLKFLAQSSASVGASVFVERVWGFPGIGLIKNDSGKLFVWGEGIAGINAPAATTIPTPVKVLQTFRWSNANLAGFTSAAASFYGTAKDSKIYTWGNNGSFQQGPIAGNFTSPAQLGGATAWTAVSMGGSHSVALKADGTMWTWGSNTVGQLATGDTLNRSIPVQIGTLSSWSQVYAGLNATFAIRTDGTLWVVGSMVSGYGGTGQVSGSVSSPVQVGVATNWSKLSVHKNFVLGIKTDGTLWSWGVNGDAQLGIGSTVSVSTPVQVGALATWSKVFTGEGISYGIRTDGSLWAWGYNAGGNLGVGTTITYSSPVRVGTATDWLEVAPGVSHALALKTNGTLWAWGENPNGQVGTGTVGTNISTPVQIGTGYWSKVMATGNMSAAIKK